MGISLIIPAFQEGDSLERTIEAVYSTCSSIDFEILIVVDTITDSSVQIAHRAQLKFFDIKLLVQDKSGPLSAIIFGIENSVKSHIVVLTADDTDDVSDILKMSKLFDAGTHYVSASRYLAGGSYTGGPKIKRLFSKSASNFLEMRHGSVASDPTNGFKGFSRTLYLSTQIQGNVGFTYGMQLLANALKNDLSAAAIPTQWHDRIEGASSFKMLKWLPAYTYWFMKLMLLKKETA